MTHQALDLAPTLQKIKNASIVASKTPQNPESKLRELISPIWLDFLKQRRMGINLIIRDELTLATGKADTVFNRLILEYKKPNTIKSDREKNKALIEQVKRYINDLAKKEHFSKERLLGVAFDGNYFLFMRYFNNWQVDEPVPVSAESLNLFLKNLEKLTSKVALIPENLIRDFAIGKDARNSVAADCIKAFYNKIVSLIHQNNTKGHIFFVQWKTQFAEVHGSLEQKKIDPKTLFDSYGFKKNEQVNFNVHGFFFALNSYYALLMKLLSYQVVGYYTLGKLTGLPLGVWGDLLESELRKKCEELEEGGFFRTIGIRNFLEGDLFSWYTQAWNDDIFYAIRQIIRHLNNYDPETMELAPDETRDILKKLYQNLVPKQIRHDLGEYYTPDWLAEHCLNQLNYNGDHKLRILDPGCGSGTFLILAIKRAKEYGQKHGYDPGETLTNIFKNIVGFDLNPVAVISARTNYMLAIADLLKHKKGEVTIPVYLCDSINPPQARIADEMTFFEKQLPYEVKTAVGNFYLPHEVVSEHKIAQLANLFEDGVKSKQDAYEFLEEARQKLKLSETETEQTNACLIAVYEKLQELEAKGINGVWARIIKNAFAPLFVGQFDLIVGNPPWVNWESLPQEYRERTIFMWQKYKLFTHKGLRARLGSAKDDISVLMTYVSIDKYLRSKGKLCFVITQTLFKTVGGGEGFRKFHLGEKNYPFKVLWVDDMVDLQPFESATNKTAVVLVKKGEYTNFPITYCVWQKIISGSISIEFSYKQVEEKTKRMLLKATTIDGSNDGPWITARPKALSAIKKIVGKSYYRAREGCSGALNSFFLVEILEENDQTLKIHNYLKNAKKKIKAFETVVEKDLFYPTLRGREIKRWIATPEIAILFCQNPAKPKNGYPLNLLIKDYPKTYSYISEFETELRSRSILKKYLLNEPFYAMYNSGDYSLAMYKVGWTRVGNDLKAAVIGNQSGEFLNNKVIIPIETVVFVPIDDENEAHFICSLLNSKVTRFGIISYANKATGSFGSPHIFENIKISKYDENNTIHKELSHLCQQCHRNTVLGIDVTDLEEQIDELAAELWGLTKQELRDIKESLEELK